MSRILTIATVALIALPAGAAAQAGAQAGASASVGVKAGAQGRGAEKSERGASAEAVLAATVRAGLPDAPVRREIARSRAREDSETATAAAASRVHARLLAAREALNDGGRRSASRREIETGAEVLARGAARADLTRISRSAPPQRSLQASLSALVEMQARGMESGRAAMDISARLAAGASDRAIGSLAAGVGGGAARAGGLLGAGAGVTGSVRGTLGGGLIP
ncbi:MAG TPA: hypothetical protein VHG28_21590 [Longimicrobiaceae bacterium]|nr:hypothetical protein [Longimicrobiaceae bacterium]